MVSTRGTLVAVLPLLGVLSACTRPGPVEGRRGCASWKQDVRAELRARCVDCHNGPAGAGGYDLTTYNGALGTGTDDIPNAVAGDPQSVLLRAVHPDSANATHRDVSGSHALLEDWVMQCQLAHGDSGIHAPGFANPADPSFHGRQLREDNWDMASCQRCHAQDFSGGPSGESCLLCHAQGVTGCATCHTAEGPRSGAHVVHRTAPTTDRKVECSSCHTVPLDWRQPGHVFGADGLRDPAPAEVVLTGAALQDVHPERRAGPPLFDGVGCSNVACHGDTLGDTSVPRVFAWSPAPTAATSCVRCHGAPPSNHAFPDQACVRCHDQVVNGAGHVVDRSLHLNGRVEVGPADGSCVACHQDAPFADTQGRTDAALTSVGAHEAHLRPRSFMSAPVACTGCHRVPARAGEPGHLDTALPAEVFGWDPTARGLGGARGAQAQWDPAEASCAATYCHGGGTEALLDTSPSITREVPWTPPGTFRVLCGSCHGVPPADPDHDPTMGSLTCVRCHPGTTDSFGGIVFQADGTSLHINGAVDVVR